MQKKKKRQEREQTREAEGAKQRQMQARTRARMSRFGVEPPTERTAEALLKYAIQVYQNMIKNDWRDPMGSSHSPLEVLNLFENAAKAGSAEAYRYMGMMYLGGPNRVGQSYKQALEYFQIAVEKGSVEALVNLGQMYLLGPGGSWGGGGVPKDPAKAIEYFQKAASKGSALGYFEAATMYLNGQGVPKNLAKAREYFQKRLMGKMAMLVLIWERCILMERVWLKTIKKP
ncbi:tetratricopeptide repeat protein [Helicobacter felistomachi]|uniref:tetratricopeptide repeat protein n=1 Tax=Helicobacter felistomachi TaxID=3040201 RepID=UPI0025732AB8|nr:tetratricopeptide repeat protein [Helicobacter sp. NHP21005]